MYTFIAYKEDCEDRCMGCVLESFSSDFVYKSSNELEDIILELIDIIVIEDNHHYGDTSYDIYILKDGEELYTPDSSTPDGKFIYDEANKQAKLINDNAELERKKKEAAHLIAIEKEKDAQEKALFEKLKQKYS